MRIETLPKTVVPLAALAFALAWQAPARADTVLAFDADYVVPVDEDDLDAGYGFALRGGQRLDLKLLTLSAELMGTMRELDGTWAPTIYEGKFGARVGVGTVLRPNAFGHVGVGHASYSGDLESQTEFAYDLGLGLDFTLLPLVNVGVHSAYNAMQTDPKLDWFTVGAHVALIL